MSLTEPVNRPGPHCPRCDGKLWKTDETGSTQEFNECAGCGWKQGDAIPEPMLPEFPVGPWSPTRLEKFVLGFIGAGIVGDGNFEKVIALTLRLLEKIDEAQMLVDGVDTREVREQCEATNFDGVITVRCSLDKGHETDCAHVAKYDDGKVIQAWAAES
jgi:hypothetical protein